jgi:hypothetical protein
MAEADWLIGEHRKNNGIQEYDDSQEKREEAGDY